MVLGMIERGEGPEERLKEAMDRFLEREQDRALFGLSLRPADTGQSHGSC